MNAEDQVLDIAETLGDYLSSRVVASQLRKRIVESGHHVTLDFSNVKSVSDSFADEFFAVLVEKRGFNWFSTNIKVSGLSEYDRETILRAIALRCNVEAA